VGAEVDALCGADYRRGSPERTNRRNGYRSPPRDTRLGTTRAQRSQSFARGATSPTGSQSELFCSQGGPDQLLATCYTVGVSTRRLEKLARRPRSRSARSPRSFEMAHSLRRQDPEPFAPVPQTAGPYPIVLGRCPGGQGARGWQDRQRPRARRHRVNARGTPERSSTPSSPPAKDKAGWLARWRSLVARGLLRVVLVILRCPPGARRGHRRGPARGGHLATVSHPRPRGICSPRWPSHEQPLSRNPGAHHLRCAGSARGRGSAPTGHRGASWEAACGCLAPRARPL